LVDIVMPAPNLAAYSITLTTETAAAQETEQDVARHRRQIVAMRRLHGTHHEPRAGDEQEGVQRAEVTIHRLLVFVEQLDVLGPGEGVGGEEHREDEHFGQDEDPDGEVAGQAAAGWSFGRRRQGGGVAHGGLRR
jgi:hypothetical protein